MSALEGALDEVRSRGHLLLPDIGIGRARGALEAAKQDRRCYGLRPSFRQPILGGALPLSAGDGAGDVRAIELDGYSFFVATRFQPEGPH